MNEITPLTDPTLDTSSAAAGAATPARSTRRRRIVSGAALALVATAALGATAVGASTPDGIDRAPEPGHATIVVRGGVVEPTIGERFDPVLAEPGMPVDAGPISHDGDDCPACGLG